MIIKRMFCAIGFTFLSLNAARAFTAIENHLPLNSTQFVTFLSNAPMDQLNASITTVVLITHGSDYNAQTYFDTGMIISRDVSQSANVLVIAPHFKPDSDTSLLPNELYWTDEGWLRGDPAENNRQISSFDAIDQMLESSFNKNVFPNVKRVIVTGHSAGGQLTQRYALGSRLQDHHLKIHFRYVVANPGSYTYLNRDRPVLSSAIATATETKGATSFQIPDSAAICDYNSYKYGLKHLNAYLSRRWTPLMVIHYLFRDVVYLLGEQDTDEGDGLDQDCPAAVQGPDRYARGLNFKAYLDHDFPIHTHRLLTVPTAGHSERAMFIAPNGLKAIFDHHFQTQK